MQESPLNLALTVIDTSGIQPFVFGSNDLKHAIGASWLVHWATHDAVTDAVLALKCRCNLDGNGAILPNLHAASGEVDAELIYCGGGNAVLLFVDDGNRWAQKFTRRLTMNVMREAPGLQVIAATLAITSHDILSRKVAEAIQLVNKRKLHREAVSAPLLGLSVTATCQYSGMPAAAERAKQSSDGALQRISCEIRAKEKAADGKANERLRKTLGQNVELIYDFDQIGEKDESSFLAVVHADGNGMGARVQAIAEMYKTAEGNIEYIEKMRAFSASIEEASTRAIRAVFSVLQKSIEKKENGESLIAGKVRLKEGRLPFRPIVFGGDDITFVTDGRLGLSLAALYLQALQGFPLSDNQGPIAGRAGVAIVKTHFPFSRAYALAEELAGSAKSILKEKEKEQERKKANAEPKPEGETKEEVGLQAIDWHFGVTGVVDNLKTLRRREFLVPHIARSHRESTKNAENAVSTEKADNAEVDEKQFGQLLMRPLLVRQGSDGDEWRTWQSFEEGVRFFRDEKHGWADKRSKVKALRDALRLGPEATQNFLAVYESGSTLPGMRLASEYRGTGWLRDERCALFDVIEALDFHVTLPAHALGHPTEKEQEGVSES